MGHSHPINLPAFGAPHHILLLLSGLSVVDQYGDCAVAALELREGTLAADCLRAGVAFEAVAGRVDDLLGAAVGAVHLPECGGRRYISGVVVVVVWC
jgi:hypothetical protein